jgi:hypothetical protein
MSMPKKYRAQTLGNFTLASAAARDWPRAIAIEGRHQGLWRLWSSTPIKEGYRSDLLPFRRSEGARRTARSPKLNAQDPEIEQALHLLENANPHE